MNDAQKSFPDFPRPVPDGSRKDIKSHMGESRKPVPVLYQDQFYVAFDKPPGLLVIPSPKKEKKTLLSLVNEQFPKSENEGRLHPCHRLDRDTSGVILFARGKKNQQIMMEEFHRRRIQKVYIAFVHGKMKNPQGEIKSAITDFDGRKFDRGFSRKMSVTRYKVLSFKRHFSVVEVYPLTGRTNQIRIHFSEIGHPLVGERKYAFAKDYPLKFKRTALHSRDLSCLHPFYKKQIHIHSPLPKDMTEFLNQN